MSEINKFKNGFYCIEPCPELHQLKAENEELNRKLKIAYTAEAFVKTQKEYTNLDKYKQCLDEIEKIVNLETCNKCPCEKQCIDDRYASCEHIRFEQILQLIKQAKEGE